MRTTGVPFNLVTPAVSWTRDIQRRWFRRRVVRTEVNNLFNRVPPGGGGSFPSNHADTSMYNPIGRLVFLEGRCRF